MICPDTVNHSYRTNKKWGVQRRTCAMPRANILVHCNVYFLLFHLRKSSFMYLLSSRSRLSSHTQDQTCCAPDPSFLFTNTSRTQPITRPQHTRHSSSLSSAALPQLRLSLQSITRNSIILPFAERPSSGQDAPICMASCRRC